MNRFRIASVLMLAGCVTEAELSSTAALSFEEFRAAATLDPHSGAFIVDGDTALHGEQALYDYWAQSATSGALAVMNKNGLDIIWSPTQRKQLTYCVSNDFGGYKSLVVSALSMAAENDWEMMGDVDFIYTPSQDATCNQYNNAVVFDVRPVVNADYLAVAFFPDAPRNERTIFIDQTSFSASWPLSGILAHELGHVLGFRHEHTRPESGTCFEDTNYRSLTPYDRASVMHYPHCNGVEQNLAFTSSDGIGMNVLYPRAAPNTPPMTQINSPQDGATVPPTFDVHASVVDTDLVGAGLFIDGELYATSQTEPFLFHVTNLAPGSHVLDVVGLDEADQATQRTIVVFVQAPAPMPDPGDGGDDDDGGGEDGGGCHAAGTSSLAMACALLALRPRRRRRA